MLQCSEGLDTESARRLVSSFFARISALRVARAVSCAHPYSVLLCNSLSRHDVRLANVKMKSEERETRSVASRI